MIMVVPPFKIGYSFRNVSGYDICTFYYHFSTVVFNGKTGVPRYPAAPKGDGWLQDQRDIILAYAKRLGGICCRLACARWRVRWRIAEY